MTQTGSVNTNHRHAAANLMLVVWFALEAMENATNEQRTAAKESYLAALDRFTAFVLSEESLF
jgi:hypothetical protein